MIRLFLILYLLLSLVCAYCSWAELLWEDEWQVLRAAEGQEEPITYQHAMIKFSDELGWIEWRKVPNVNVHCYPISPDLSQVIKSMYEDDGGDWAVLRTVTPAPSPTPRQDCKVTPNRVFRGMCRDK